MATCTVHVVEQVWQPNSVLSYVAYDKSGTELNVKLRSALKWWLRVLRQRVVFLTCSDEEGSYAGVGVAVWGYSPLAAFLIDPWEVRMWWSSQHELFDVSFWDIYEIEARGPLVILATWPGLLAGSLWIHFIDTAAAPAPLVCGSFSVTSGDDIVGLTWEMIHHRVIPWFDRVDGTSNPVDGLSRRRQGGPWHEVFPGLLPKELLRRLRRRAFD